MAIFDTLFGKKKKELKASCTITKEPIEKGFGYMLTTAQVIPSKKYWDMIMTEPETLSYTVDHFKGKSSGTQMRSMIFEKYAGIAKPWMISDSIIGFFDGIDKKAAKENAKKWWESEGTFVPENAGSASDKMDEAAYKQWKDYAILEAGRDKMK